MVNEHIISSYIWSDTHNNDINVVVQLHTTKSSLEVDSSFAGVVLDGNFDI